VAHTTQSVLFFLLYFNRLFATLLSYAIRAYTWHYYRVYVDIKALQVSLLGGRIFFKGIRYHGANETIFIHGGFITWRYWKRKVERTNLSGIEPDTGRPRTSGKERNDSVPGERTGATSGNDSVGEQGGVEKTVELPCRISIKAYGLEWFIYNRTPAYDNILAGFGYKDSTGGEDMPEPGSPPEPQPNLQRSKTTFDTLSEHSSSEREALGTRNTELREAELSDSVSSMLELLPVKLDCSRGAIVIGNENTRSVLTTTFDSAAGTIAACKSGPMDLYRQLFSFKFKHPVVQMRPNPDFKQNQLATAKVLAAEQEDEDSSKPKTAHLKQRFISGKSGTVFATWSLTFNLPWNRSGLTDRVAVCQGARLTFPTSAGLVFPDILMKIMRTTMRNGAQLSTPGSQQLLTVQPWI
jgi:hypothetical protein